MQTNPLRARPKFAFAVIAAIAAVVVGGGLAGRRSQAEALVTEAQERSVPTVNLLPVLAANQVKLELPGRIEAWARAPIYSRVNGYLQRWNADIGAPVKAGQLLGSIDTPDLNQDLRQAQAELASARTNLVLAESTAKRWQSLLGADAVSKQEVDEKDSDLAAKRGAVQALQASVDRQLALKRYTRLTAPFDGVVTARNTDVGALINAGGAAGSELFVISDISRLRVYVQVPQRQVPLIRPGLKATLEVPERPGVKYEAKVQSSANAINSGSGGMLVQLVVENHSGELLPGAFANVQFDTAAPDQGVTVPPGAIIYGKSGVHVGTVGRDSRVHLKEVKIVRDLGTVVQLSGLKHDERIIDSPPDGLAEGDSVKIAVAGGRTGQ